MRLVAYGWPSFFLIFLLLLLLLPLIKYPLFFRHRFWSAQKGCTWRYLTPQNRRLHQCGALASPRQLTGGGLFGPRGSFFSAEPVCSPNLAVPKNTPNYSPLLNICFHLLFSARFLSSFFGPLGAGGVHMGYWRTEIELVKE